MSDALDVRNLRKEYPGFVLKDISFRLPAGYIMGLIGPNGAGKTTVIKLILNIVRRNAGDIRLFGRDNGSDDPDLKSRLGFVLDEPPFYSYLKVRSMAGVVAPFYKTWDGELFAKLCREFEVPPEKRIGALSRGMIMKLGLALALAHRAELILLDEPTSGLDPVFRREFLERLSALIQDGRTSVLFSTHIASDLERVADYITCLRDGELVFSTTRDDILDNWAVVKGGNDLLSADIRQLFRTVHSGPHGFSALTVDQNNVRRRLEGRDVAIEKIRLDDLIYFLGLETGHD